MKRYHRRPKIFMRHNKYLEDLGLKREQFAFNSYPLHRTLKHLMERRVYGMDSRETYNLDITFMEWLYTRLSMYKKKAGQVIDLSFTKFEYGGKEYTLEELIDKILRLCKFYFKNSIHVEKSNIEKIGECEKLADEAMQKATRIFALILPALWW